MDGTTDILRATKLFFITRKKAVLICIRVVSADTLSTVTTRWLKSEHFDLFSPYKITELVIIVWGNTCSLFGTSPLPAKSFECHYKEKRKWNMNSKYITFHSREWCIWRCPMQKCGHFVHGSVYQSCFVKRLRFSGTCNGNTQDGRRNLVVFDGTLSYNIHASMD